MSWLKDYIDGRRKQANPIESVLPVPMNIAEPPADEPNGSVGNTAGNTAGTVAPAADAGGTSAAIDSNNVIGSLVDLMGPTPVERAERERRIEKNKSVMSAWAGLFDGLRHLGNLYYTSKQATPQVYNNPYEQIDKDIEASRKRMDDLENYKRQYNLQLYNLQRQGEQDKMAAEQHKAQMANYAANNELTKARVESERVRAEQQAALNKARQEQIEEKTRQMRDKFPLEQQKLEQTIRKIMHDAGRPYGAGRSGSGSSSDPYAELATLLNDNPDVIGPILEQEGYGYYDSSTGEFQFTKHPSKGMTRTAVDRARSSGGRSGGGRSGGSGGGRGSTGSSNGGGTRTHIDY